LSNPLPISPEDQLRATVEYDSTRAAKYCRWGPFIHFATSVGVNPSVIGRSILEPTALTLLAISACGLMSRQRRRFPK